MNIHEDTIKHYLKNVYFINGTAYAGKSTICKLLAEKYNMYHFHENHMFGDFLSRTTPTTHPNMNYFKTMGSWEEFVTRNKEDYVSWMENVSRETTEFEILELISIAKHQTVIVDSNILPDVLEKISDYHHIAYMVTTPEISTNHFFERSDKEKQFLLQVLEGTKDSEKNIQNYREILLHMNRQEVIDRFVHSGFFCLQRTSIDDDIYEKLHQIEQHFGLTKEE